LDSTLFAPEAALSEIVGFCGSYVAVGVGLGLAFWVLGYVVYFLIDTLKGGV